MPYITCLCTVCVMIDLMKDWQIFFDEVYEFERREDINFNSGNDLLDEARRSERVKAYDKLIENRC